MEDNKIIIEEADIGIEDLGVAAAEEVDEDAIAQKIPPLSSANIALRNSLKLMDGKYGGSFNVRFVQDDVKKYGWLELIIAYPDNTVKNIYLYKNAFRETDTDSSGIYMPSETASRKNAVRDWDNDYSKCDFSFVEHYSSPNMPIPARLLWDRITEHYNEIPIVKIRKTSSLESVYFQMAKLAAQYSKCIGLSFMDSDEYFYVTTKDFNTIARRNGWEPQALKVEFDKAPLFIKDKTGGYQKSKKVNGRHVHYYALSKELLYNENEQTSLQDTEYQQHEKSQVEKLKEHYEHRLAQLRKEMEQAIIEKRPPNPNDVMI